MIGKKFVIWKQNLLRKFVVDLPEIARRCCEYNDR